MNSIRYTKRILDSASHQCSLDNQHIAYKVQSLGLNKTVTVTDMTICYNYGKCVTCYFS